jgi:hypothetical protein
VNDNNCGFGAPFGVGGAEFIIGGGIPPVAII